MHAIVKNFRGIIEASIDIEPIALLCGTNGAGKTSIARAIAAAATGKPIPFAKITKKDCATLLRHGTHSGGVTLGDDLNSTTIEWPKAEVFSIGTPPYASEIATGLTDIFSMKEADALSYLITLLKASPTLSDLKASFAAASIPEAITESVWKVIEAQGWDAAHKRAVETGQQRKGAWQQIAGTAYGKKKAEDFLPEGWEDHLFQKSIETLESEIIGMRGDLEAAIGKSAVSKAEREQLQQQADKLEGLAEEQTRKEKEIADLTKRKGEIEKELSETPNPKAAKDYSCPHCEKPVNVTPTTPGHFTLTKVKEIDPKKAKELALKHAGLCGEQTNVNSKLGTAQNELRDIVRQIDLGVDAERKLKTMGADLSEESAETVAEARQIIATLEKQKKMIAQYNDARNANKQVLLNQAIVDQLDETGIRKKKLAECIDAFMSSYISPLCDDFGIPLISIDADLNVDMGSTSYQLLSASEQFRVRTVLQVAIAQLEKSSLVIIDGADILDRTGRDGLFNMLTGTGLYAVICMTLNNAKIAPDLQSSGAGTTYWVERGKIKQVGEEKATA